jgi:hypothetical protein
MHMKKFALFALALAGLGLSGAMPSVPQAQAQGYYDDDDDYRRDRYYRRHHHRTYDRCKATIRGTGVGNIVPAIARINAKKAWKREARAVYGVNYDYDSAKSRSISCDAYGISTRCTASGRPCP